MKRFLSLSACIITITALMGCRPEAVQPTKVQNTETPVKVSVDEGEIPEFLAGRWIADKDGWQFVFGEDGTISSAVISFGRVPIKAGQVTRRDMKQGGKAIYEPGEWQANYEQTTRQLTVVISMEHLYAEIGDGTIEGNSKDVFVGAVSEDFKYWIVDWTSFYEYTIKTPDIPGTQVHSDPNYGATKKLIFEKR